ncbi:TetR/AcrR family transcriptional regulator [Nitriliruptor alkaliphilus]|uniref:TetR/AcrR family transcriptional regulator n=1 Tax=Nitriliruptor alkaliphilus TaxID=427918 RepID=UPI000697A779|nr:TetR/AcrR family transcriptional regulator [Nitriliruptor alkaliphilus]
MDLTQARTSLLEAADELFYTRGLQVVGVDEVRAAAGISLKRLYQCYPSKEALIDAYLDRRDRRWRAELRTFVTDQAGDARGRVLAVFDSLEHWFAQPEFRGCAFINAYGELGEVSELVAERARQHKRALHGFLRDLVADDADDPDTLASQLLVLIDGAIVSASFRSDPGAARLARSAAEPLLDSHLHAPGC